jgi:hypothetical protein
MGEKSITDGGEVMEDNNKNEANGDGVFRFSVLTF